MLVWPGQRYPLGATYDGVGTNFALYSSVAESVDLCLFDAAGNERRIPLPEVDAYVWHVFLTGVQPGQRYGFRVHGAWDPARGQRCNPHKLLLDPYAKAVDGDPYFDWTNARPPRTPYHDTVVYEGHVRGLTMRHPAVPDELRGTYAGLAHPAVVEHLKRLGVTAIELMP